MDANYKKAKQTTNSIVTLYGKLAELEKAGKRK